MSEICVQLPTTVWRGVLGLYVNVYSWKNVQGTIPGLKNSKNNFVASEGTPKGLSKKKEGTLCPLQVCIFACRSAHVCAFSSLPLSSPTWLVWVSNCCTPSREQLWKDLIQLTVHNILLKKYYLFACLKRHKDNIHVCDPDCLWSRGRDCADRIAFQHPRDTRQSTAVLYRRGGQSPQHGAALLAVLCFTAEEVWAHWGGLSSTA